MTQHLAVITPVFNDWDSFQRLVNEIDESLSSMQAEITIITVDDSSSQHNVRSLFAGETFRVIRHIEIVHLARNIGHQRAIAIGLSYLEKNHTADSVVVIDADGEDRPSDLPKLLERQQETNGIVFARRGQRQEGGIFRIFNFIYRILFSALTGKRIPFGNYCVIPGSMLKQIVFLPEIWNHLAAGILRSGLPQSSIRIDRGKRYFGKSKMNFVALVMHGLSAFSVYTDILSVRLMLLTLLVAFITVIGALVLLYVRYLTNLAIPGWATNVGFGLVIILMQSFLLLLSITFNVLNSRTTQTYIPAKHFQDFILNVEVCYG